MDEEENAKGKLTTTISLGNLLNIVAILGSVGLLWINLSSGIARLEERESSIETRLANYEKDHDTLINLAAEVHTIVDGKPPSFRR